MLVVDTSVAIKWVVPEDGVDLEPDTAIALSVLELGLIAPDLIAAEFANALWKKVSRREMGDAQAIEAMDILPTMVSLLPMEAYAKRALEIALQLDHPVYDCVFIAVAEAHATNLVTADRRLVERAASSVFGPLVVNLASRAW